MGVATLALPLLATLAAAPPASDAAPAPATATAEQSETSEPTPPPPPPDWQRRIDPTLLQEILEGRRRPGYQPALPEAVTQDNPGAIRALPPSAFPTETLPIPDRWRLITALCPVQSIFVALQNTCHSRFDPYHQNLLKGDRPLNLSGVPRWFPFTGNDWFLTLSAISDTVVEPRTFPIPVGVQTTERPDSNNVFGRPASLVLSQTFITGFGLTKGMTAFKPPDLEYRVAIAFNMNYVDVPERRVLNVEPSRPSHRFDHFLGVQEAFIDRHLGNDSDRYDFHSIRVGIQPFQADFRGFLFNDNQLGVRIFGNRDNNRFQYNLAAFWRLEKDTNSGLNNVMVTPRRDWVFAANLYRQDLPVPGLTSQVTVVYNRNRESGEIHIDDNGFPIRPALFGTLRTRDYDVVYVGYNADGRIGRVNLTASAYGAFGQDRFNPITDRVARIEGYFAAAEASYDHNWMRFRLSALYATGDGDAYDDVESGFDAIFENPQFAGADTSYWIRQSIPFAGGGRAVSVNGRNGILNSLRSSKDEGQSNFTNPGTMLIGVGGDFDLRPDTRVSANINHLWFENTAVIEVLRNQGSISRDIGWDVSVSGIYRPNTNQNIVMRLSAAALVPGKGFDELFDNSPRTGAYYSILANAILSF
ncbi:MAG: hypothetical protein AABZ45_01555 [Pseudomonadota bacterium]